MFIEVFFPGDALEDAGFQGRDEVEDPLNEALEPAGVGEVIGGGGGANGINIDIEIYDESRIDEAMALIRTTLQELGAPPTTTIRTFDYETSISVTYDLQI